MGDRARLRLRARRVDAARLSERRRDLRQYALDALDREGRPGRIAHVSDDPIGLRALVASGLATTVLPSAAISPPLEIATASAGAPALPTIAFSAYRQTARANADAGRLGARLAEALSHAGR